MVYLGIFWFVSFVLDSSTKDFHPGNRLLVQKSISKRWMTLAWILLMAATVAGVGYALFIGSLSFSLNWSNMTELLIDLEGLISVLLLIILAAISFILLVRFREIKLVPIRSQIDEKLDRSMVSGSMAKSKFLSPLLLLCWSNVVLCTCAIILGILVSAT